MALCGMLDVVEIIFDANSSFFFFYLIKNEQTK